MISILIFLVVVFFMFLYIGFWGTLAFVLAFVGIAILVKWIINKLTFGIVD